MEIRNQIVLLSSEKKTVYYPPHPPLLHPFSQVFKMSIAREAAKAMLSDALLQDSPGINRIRHLELELPLDKVIKFVSVGLPLMLVTMAFAREISLGEKPFT